MLFDINSYVYFHVFSIPNTFPHLITFFIFLSFLPLSHSQILKHTHTYTALSNLKPNLPTQDAVVSISYPGRWALARSPDRDHMLGQCPAVSRPLGLPQAVHDRQNGCGLFKSIKPFPMKRLGESVSVRWMKATRGACQVCLYEWPQMPCAIMDMFGVTSFKGEGT